MRVFVFAFECLRVFVCVCVYRVQSFPYMFACAFLCMFVCAFLIFMCVYVGLSVCVCVFV